MLKRILFLCLILVVGCESGGPEFVDGDDAQSFAGILRAEDTSQRHDFLLTSEGTVRFEVIQLSVTDPESGLPVESPSIVLAIGRRSIEDGCGISFSRAMVAGNSFPIYLDDTAYCLQVFRGSNLPLESIVAYDIALVPAFS